jgi:3-methyladenine DNA glycosylase AlkD
MQRYMKSAMPFLGVQARGIGEALRGRAADLNAALDLWENARFREERYAALGLLPPDTPFPVLERLVVEGAWWDLVDGLAKRIGPRPELRDWASDPNLWKRRSAIICQVGRKGATDLDLLRHAVEANLADRELFIRKAIGWALRGYAWHDPAWVRAYIEELGDRLSPLSRREATRNLARLGA